MISHHPADETLAAYAAGTLDEGSAFVIAAHLSFCRSCRYAVEDFECIGGSLLDMAEPMPMLSGRADSGHSALAERPAARAAAVAREGNPIDRLLSLYRQEPWKWLGVGVKSATLDIPRTDGIRVFLLKAAAGTAMPRHTHTGTELTLVLQGAFTHQFGRFAPGDIEEADGSVDHRPMVEKNEECICLVAMSGELKLQGLAGRFLQPFVRV